MPATNGEAARALHGAVEGVDDERGSHRRLGGHGPYDHRARRGDIGLLHAVAAGAFARKVGDRVEDLARLVVVAEDVVPLTLVV